MESFDASNDNVAVEDQMNPAVDQINAEQQVNENPQPV